MSPAVTTAATPSDSHTPSSLYKCPPLLPRLLPMQRKHLCLISWRVLQWLMTMTMNRLLLLHQVRDHNNSCDQIFTLTADISMPPSVASSPRSSARTSMSTDSCTLVDASPRHPLAVIPARRNEHLAVLLPKNLWKVSNLIDHHKFQPLIVLQPDSLASCCDNFYCRIQFSLFERRHVSALLLTHDDS